MAQGTETAVERRTRIAAGRDTVFEFFTDAEKMTRWMGSAAELEPRPGGAFRVDVRGPWRARGEFLELDPPGRVVFTWGWEKGSSLTPGSSTVEVTLEADGDGTVVTLVHRDLPGDESRAAHAHGWEGYLARLAIAAAGGDPGPDRVVEGAA